VSVWVSEQYTPRAVLSCVMRRELRDKMGPWRGGGGTGVSAIDDERWNPGYGQGIAGYCQIGGDGNTLMGRSLQHSSVSAQFCLPRLPHGRARSASHQRSS
jgi:hypothetical protein